MDNDKMIKIVLARKALCQAAEGNITKKERMAFREAARELEKIERMFPDEQEAAFSAIAGPSKERAKNDDRVSRIGDGLVIVNRNA
jgi:hypothetical protein